MYPFTFVSTSTFKQKKKKKRTWLTSKEDASLFTCKHILSAIFSDVPILGCGSVELESVERKKPGQYFVNVASKCCVRRQNAFEHLIRIFRF